MLCSGIILNRTAGDYRITCRIVMRTKLYDQTISTVIHEDISSSTTQVFSSIETTRIIIVLKRLILKEVMQINNRYVRVVQLGRMIRKETGIYVTFEVAPTMCSTTSKINLEQLYSPSCPVDTNAFTVSCNGTVELTKDGKHKIQCAEEHVTAPAVNVGLVEGTEETTITTSIKQMIITEAVKVDGHAAHFDKLIKRKTTETGIEVEFTVTDADYTDPSQSAFDTIYSETSTQLTYTKKVLCKGTLSLVPGVKDTVKCEGRDDNVEQDTVKCEGRDDNVEQTDPSKPTNGSSDPTVVGSIEYSKVVHKVERLVFIEKMTISGYYVRVNQLTKYEKVDTGIDIAFTVIPTGCETKVKVTIDQLYSAMCIPQSSSDPIECKGILPFQQTFMHHIKCFFSDGTEMPLGPSTSDPMDAEGLETAEMTEVTTRIKEMMIAKKFSIRNHHAQLDTLITHKTVDTGIEVEFTITETTCDINNELTAEELYDPSCVVHVQAKRLICKGIIYNIPGLKDNVQCSERDDVEEFDPSKPATPGSDPTTVKPEEITIEIRKLMYFNAMTINKHHVRVESLTKVEKVTSGAFVEFTIAQTTCSERLSVKLDELYSERCISLYNTSLVTCKGLLPLVHGVSHTIRCSGGDKLTDKDSSRPSIPSTGGDEQLNDRSRILSRVKLLAFSEKFTIKGSYARVDLLTNVATVQAGTEVEFSITASACSIRLTITLEQLYSTICSPQQPSAFQICKGVLPSNAHTQHTIKCGALIGDEEHDEPTTPTPEETTPPPTKQDIQITKSVKRLIATEKITIEGKLAKFEKLIRHEKTETGIEVEFIVADSNSEGTTEGSTGTADHEAFTRPVRKLRCKGVLSLLPGVKDKVECEEVKDQAEQVN
ncbi:hypothetical protein M514_28173, partial [Trichuris suis]